MSGSALLLWLSNTWDFLRTLGSDLPGWLLVRLLEAGQNLQPLQAGGLILGLAASSVWGAYRLQKQLNQTIQKDPKAHCKLSRLQWQASVLRLVLIVLFLPLYLLWQAGRGGVWCVRKLLSWWRGRKQEKPATPVKGVKTKEKPSQTPHLTATLGPSYLLAALAVVVLYLLARVTDPLLAARFELSPGASGWQFLLLGLQPSSIAYLPLEQQPWLAAVLAFLLWASLWALLGFILRWTLGRDLGRDLLTERDRPECLSWWREGFACEYLHRPAPSYQDWVSWPLGLAVPLLVWSWLWVGSDPYRLDGSLFAIGLLVWLSWLLTLLLRGSYQPLAEPEAKKAPSGERINPHWLDVLDDLRQRYQVGEPETFAYPRPVRPPSRAGHGLGNLLSPLLDDLIQALPVNGGTAAGLTHMQRQELDRLAVLGHVHTPAPSANPGELNLQQTADLGGQKADRRERNSIVLGPEGWGKTTLAMLAAVNHSLVHTRNTLVILPRRRQADTFYQELHNWLAPSTLRWNVRVRQMDHDLIEDLDQGIQPDVVVCDLENLVVQLLDRHQAFVPFLRHLGLIVLDDAESFTGAGELHAQLALRRLHMLIQDAQSLPDLDQQLASEQQPLFLVLATDSMHQSATWLEKLCGIRAEARRYGPDHEKKELEADQLEDIQAGKHHRFYRLSAFRTASDEPLALEALIECCERCEVPWHYRWCGDHRRHLGRKPLHLVDDPNHGRRNAHQACVVLLDGTWSAVQRELRRLCLAGLHFHHRQRVENGELLPPREPVADPIALVCRISPDEDAAFTQADDRAELAELLATLPRPVLRSPDSATARSHLASDLTQRWSEVADLVHTFGPGVHATLQELARENLLLAEPRTDIHPTAYEYEPKLYVRAFAQAVAKDATDETRTPLPTKVSQVQWTTEHPLRLVDRTTMLTLDVVDADSARIAFYPGRIFVASNGRHVIIPQQPAEQEGGAKGTNKAQDEDPTPRLYSEPLLADSQSSPRRWTTVHVRQDGRCQRRDPSMAARPYFGPERVVLGDFPLRLSLAKVTLEVRHSATYRLRPITGRLHQRQIFAADRENVEPIKLTTEAVGLFPNPDLPETDPPPPRLTRRQARLLAAALRLALTSLYRSAEDLIEIALHLHPGKVDDEHVLELDEGLFFFDLYAGGNGTARALHREGIELLLRMARAVLERNLYPRRLLNRHDQWPDSSDNGSSQDSRQNAATIADQQQQDDQELRRGTLDWLDSRLPPEGGPIAQDLGVTTGATSEKSTYYSIDAGRCWAPAGRLDRDLVWVKHRWRLEPLGEAMLDIGFERSDAEQTRLFTEKSDVLLAYRLLYEKTLSQPDLLLDDGTIWGAPRPVTFPAQGKDKFEHSVLQPEAEPDQSATGGRWLPSYHSLASAVAAHTGPLLEPLSQRLWQLAEENLRRYAAADSPALQLQRQLTYLARFVQGLPYSLPTSLQQGLRPPITTLLYRRGDCDSKSLLLALLLKHAGTPAGLFVSLNQHHAVAAVAVPGAPDVDTAKDGELAVFLADWSQQVGLQQPPCFWSTLPSFPGSGDNSHLFVPIEATAYQAIGAAPLNAPDTWSFLPLETIEQRFDLDNRPAAADNLEQRSP